MQENNANTGHECYLSYVSLVGTINQFEAFDQSVYAATQTANGVGVGTYAGYVTSLVKLAMDGQLNFLNLYSNCKLDNLLISAGQKLNTFPGFFDALIGGIFEFINLDTGTLGTCLTNANYGCIGTALGTIVFNFFDATVPDYTYG